MKPEEMKSALEALGYEVTPPKIKPIELKGGEYTIASNSSIGISPSAIEWRNAGAEFATLDVAEAVAAQRLKRNRLEAYAVEFMGEVYIFKSELRNYYVYYNHRLRKWALDYTESYEGLHVYMTKECADYLCDALNSGRIVL